MRPTESESATTGDMLVIVSAARFEKARDADQRPLRVGSVYPIDRFVSSHKALPNKLAGDLYLVTVRRDTLWLVGVLRRPRHAGDAWKAAPNTLAIVDVTQVAPQLVFDTGSGIHRERMAMSLQCPRALTSGDVARLQGAIDAAPSAEAGAAVVEATVVKVAAVVLGRSEA